jgi:hypothetical protein
MAGETSTIYTLTAMAGKFNCLKKWLLTYKFLESFIKSTKLMYY